MGGLARTLLLTSAICRRHVSPRVVRRCPGYLPGPFGKSQTPDYGVCASSPPIRAQEFDHSTTGPKRGGPQNRPVALPPGVVRQAGRRLWAAGRWSVPPAVNLSFGVRQLAAALAGASLLAGNCSPRLKSRRASSRGGKRQQAAALQSLACPPKLRGARDQQREGVAIPAGPDPALPAAP